MKSYYLVEHDHTTNQFSMANAELELEVLDVGNCYTADVHEVADLESVGVFPQFGWYWSRYDKASDSKVNETYDKLEKLLFSNSISPKSLLARLKGSGS